MNNKATTVCFSGHRVFQDPTADIEKKLDKAVRDCISKGAECFVTGGALGFDTLAARTVIRLREEFPQIKLILALPCPPQAQTLKWSAAQVAEYQEIISLSDVVRVLSPEYTQSCMLDRNRYENIYNIDTIRSCMCFQIIYNAFTQFVRNVMKYAA